MACHCRPVPGRCPLQDPGPHPCFLTVPDLPARRSCPRETVPSSPATTPRRPNPQPLASLPPPCAERLGPDRGRRGRLRARGGARNAGSARSPSLTAACASRNPEAGPQPRSRGPAGEGRSRARAGMRRGAGSGRGPGTRALGRPGPGERPWTGPAQAGARGPCCSGLPSPRAGGAALVVCEKGDGEPVGTGRRCWGAASGPEGHRAWAGRGPAGHLGEPRVRV